MKKLQLLIAVVLVGIVVACTYFIFEYAVHHSINYIWEDLLNTDTKRLLVVPLCIALTTIYFALQHFLDRKSETHEAHGLGGGAIDATIKNFATILLIGFFSLVAGASLGPEAVLVPACMVVGAYVATKLFKGEKQVIGALAGASIIALFAAFFHSFIIGFLAVFLVTKQAKVKLSPQLVVIAVIASGVATLTLNVIDPKQTFFNWPDYSWETRIIDVLIAVGLAVVGYALTFALKAAHDIFVKLRSFEHFKQWWQQALIASVGLSTLYLLGGPLVQFTGNEAIQPMYSQAATLGILGLAWIALIKLLAIGWSKAMGYRGGMVFPVIFLASVLVVIAIQIYPETNFIIALIGTMAGAIAAERKAKILF